ncbi:hypothetical protein [Flavobacterium soyae]|uniref:hypothetical protein n=1 Tax=Flavobacterium soyae TaxID=2903098 RepID=UPI001E3E2E1B|nr:hypothetical protein [Flavobacterium soyae]MCD9574205.1 hypothetical protein [Flavobacterium soyae]
MEVIKKIIQVENNESEIPKWQINEVRKRTENYLKNPNNANDIDDFLKEIESDLNLFK